MNVQELIDKLHALPAEHKYLPVVSSDYYNGEREIETAEVEVPYTGIGHWLVLK